MTLGTVQLRGTPVVTSTLGFGTTGLAGLTDQRAGVELIEAAFDPGVRHFGTAPYYGFGEVEGR